MVTIDWGDVREQLAELAHVGNVKEIEKILQPLDKDQKVVLLLDAIKGNFEALSLCACNWCEVARNES